MNVLSSMYPETAAGGFTRLDGTVQFFQRVQALLDEDATVLDFGAGRGLLNESSSRTQKRLTDLRGPRRSVIGLDIDEAVLTNPRLNKALVATDGKIPLEDSSVDIIVSDNVFEHIDDPISISGEFYRVLRSGGWICARTPYLYSALVLASSLIPNQAHSSVLKYVQPNGRAKKDIFPTRYRMNSHSKLRKIFKPELWSHHSYTWSPEPGYHFGKVWFARLFSMYQFVKSPFGGEFLMIFIQKK